MKISLNLEHLSHLKTLKINPHVGKPLSFKERRIISKIRLGILPLRIETARYLRPVVPECQRTCYCGSGLVESEYYVLFECQVYKSLREAWLNKLVKTQCQYL